MTETQLREMISSYTGPINSSFLFVKLIQKKLNFTLGLDLSSSYSLQRYTNLVRNLIGREVVEKPIKSGRNIILNERTLLQLLVARKYLASGCSMESLKGYLIEMPVESLYERLFASQLPDLEIVAQRATVLSNERGWVGLTVSPKITRKKLFQHVKIGTDLLLVVADGEYTDEEVEEMRSFLARVKNKRGKL